MGTETIFTGQASGTNRRRKLEMRKSKLIAGGRMKRRSFTLIELLMVIAIIAIMVGILLPVLARVKLQAKREKARHSVQQIAVAWTAYLSDYRHFPQDASGQTVPVIEMDTNTMNILAGKQYNPNGIQYFDFATNELRAAGMLDPWSTRYQVSLDNGRSGGRSDAQAYDGTCMVPHTLAGVRRSAVSWSQGPDMRDDSTSTRLDDVKSWE
jgi:prepilin-type N-terminal cleavage/methylation domain-containing protein